jgi:hypothetical protein
MNLRDNSCRFKHVFEHRLDPNAVKHSIFERQFMTIGDQNSVLRRVDICTDKFDRRIVVQFFGGRPRWCRLRLPRQWVAHSFPSINSGTSRNSPPRQDFFQMRTDGGETPENGATQRDESPGPLLRNVDRSNILVTKSIRTGCASMTGNPVLLYWQTVLEQNGRRSRFCIGDEHRGQRTPLFHALDLTEQSEIESAKLNLK